MILELKNLTFAHDAKSLKTLKNINLTLEQGQILGLVGPSGSGKTTLARLITKEIIPHKGDVITQGLIACVKQFGPNTHQTLKDYCLDQGQDLTQLRELLGTFNLETKMNIKLNYLSGGELRRVCIIKALLKNSDLLILDEPFNGLDQMLIRELGQDLKKYLRKNNKSLLLITHHLNQALCLCDKIAVLNDGKIEQTSSPTELIKKPINSFVAKYFELSNIFITHYKDGNLKTPFGDFPYSKLLLENTQHLCMTRPWQHSIGNTGPKAKVAAINYYGSYTDIELLINDSSLIVRDYSNSIYSIGQRLQFSFDINSLHFLKDISVQFEESRNELEDDFNSLEH